VVQGGVGDAGQGRLLQQISDHPEVLLKPEIGQMLPDHVLTVLRGAVIQGVTGVFLAACIAALVCLLVVVVLPRRPSAPSDG
jgi:hypothetical protein